jgi:hypothetical protein
LDSKFYMDPFNNLSRISKNLSLFYFWAPMDWMWGIEERKNITISKRNSFLTVACFCKCQ